MKAVCAILAAAVCGVAQTPDCKLVDGWAQQGAARVYDASSLYDYMDGNSEGYLLYSFLAMHGVTCVRGEDSILIDISEFQTPDLAYGMFTANRDPRIPETKLGAGGQITPRRAVFVKDRYYAEFAANPEKDHTAALLAFASAIEKRLPGSSRVPEALDWFPRERQQSVRLIPESVLGLRAISRGYVAEYDFGKAFVDEEPSPEAALAVMAKLRARFAQSSDPITTTDRYLGALCFMRKGRFVLGYANVAEGNDPVALAGALAARLP